MINYLKANMINGWVPIRKRDEYTGMKKDVFDALDVYWETIGAEHPLWTKYVYACESIVLKSYRLLKYLRKEYGGIINPRIDDRKIGETWDAASDFYCLGDDSFQKESDILEVLSRAAYREMKAVKKAQIAEEEMEVWRY